MWINDGHKTARPIWTNSNLLYSHFMIGWSWQMLDCVYWFYSVLQCIFPYQGLFVGATSDATTTIITIFTRLPDGFICKLCKL